MSPKGLGGPIGDVVMPSPLQLDLDIFWRHVPIASQEPWHAPEGAEVFLDPFEDCRIAGVRLRVLTLGAIDTDEV